MDLIAVEIAARLGLSLSWASCASGRMSYRGFVLLPAHVVASPAKQPFCSMHPPLLPQVMVPVPRLPHIS
jgi:hypothetical protein